MVSLSIAAPQMNADSSLERSSLTPPDFELAVEAAKSEDLRRIENLMQFYNYDLSQWLPVSFGDHGLYAIASKRDYWAKPEVRPFVARISGELVGFAVIDDEFVSAGAQFNVGYFFVARRYRGQGVGYRLFRSVLARHPGRWQLYHYKCNESALHFWPKAISRAGGSMPAIHETLIDEQLSVVYSFSAEVLSTSKARSCEATI